MSVKQKDKINSGACQWVPLLPAHPLYLSSLTSQHVQRGSNGANWLGDEDASERAWRGGGGETSKLAQRGRRLGGRQGDGEAGEGGRGAGR